MQTRALISIVVTHYCSVACDPCDNWRCQTSPPPSEIITDQLSRISRRFAFISLPHTAAHMSEQSDTKIILRGRTPPKDCLYDQLPPWSWKAADRSRACRLTGAATFTGLGIYAMRQAQLQGAFQRVRPKGAPVIGGQVTAVIGLGTLSLAS